MSINFSNARFSELASYFSNQPEDTQQMVSGWLQKFGMDPLPLNPAATVFHIQIVRHVAVRAEIWSRHGLLFEEFMAEKFGFDWEQQLQTPRGSQSGGKRIDIGIKKANKEAAEFNQQLLETGATEGFQAMQIASRSIQTGIPILSLRPIAEGANPCLVNLNGEITEIHKPGIGDIGCRNMLTEIFLAPIFVRLGNTASSDITGSTKTSKVLVTGFTEHFKRRKCGKIGNILVGGDLHNIPDENHSIAELLLAAEMAELDRKQLFRELIRNSGLYSYYKYYHPTQDPWKLVSKAFSGGTLKLKYFNSEWVTKEFADSIGITGETKTRTSCGQTVEFVHSPHTDFRQSMERKISWNEEEIQNRIRLMAGLIERLASPAEQIIDRSIREWEKNPTGPRPTGEKLPDISVLDNEQFREEVINQMRKRHNAKNRQDNRAIQPKNFGKMLRSKSSKLRNGDKSCAVNGVRSINLENQFALLRIEVNGEIQFSEPVNREKLLSTLSNWGFNWEGYARKRIELGEFKPAWTAADAVGEINTGLTRKENRESLAEIMLTKMLAGSFKQLLQLKNGWVTLARSNSTTGEFWYESGMTIQFRHIFGDTETFGKLKDAVQLVRDCEEELTESTILSAFRKPATWERLRAEVRGNVMKNARFV